MFGRNIVTARTGTWGTKALMGNKNHRYSPVKRYRKFKQIVSGDALTGKFVEKTCMQYFIKGF